MCQIEVNIPGCEGCDPYLRRPTDLLRSEHPDFWPVPWHLWRWGSGTACHGLRRYIKTAPCHGELPKVSKKKMPRRYHHIVRHILMLVIYRHEQIEHIELILNWYCDVNLPQSFCAKVPPWQKWNSNFTSVRGFSPAPHGGSRLDMSGWHWQCPMIDVKSCPKFQRTLWIIFMNHESYDPIFRHMKTIRKYSKQRWVMLKVPLKSIKDPWRKANLPWDIYCQAAELLPWCD